MTKTNLPANQDGDRAMVPAEDAAAVLDALVLDLPEMEDDNLTARTLARIMSAENPAEIFANPELEGFRSVIGIPLILNGVLGRLPSAFGEDRYFLLYDVTVIATGERRTISSGSPYVAASALTARARRLLPAEVVPLELDSKRTPGTSSLWLVMRRLANNA